MPKYRCFKLPARGGRLRQPFQLTAPKLMGTSVGHQTRKTLARNHVRSVMTVLFVSGYFCCKNKCALAFVIKFTASSPCCRITNLSTYTVVFCCRLEGVTDESVEFSSFSCSDDSSCSCSDDSSDDQGMEDLRL